nr:transcription repressor OFP6-like [Ipomoea batatas]
MFDGSISVPKSGNETSEDVRLHISLLVDIEKKEEGGKALEFVCSAWPDSLEIQARRIAIFTTIFGGPNSPPSSTPNHGATINGHHHHDVLPAYASSDADSEIKSLRAVQGFGRIGGESVAVEKDSDDPYLDFRHSMLQMILEKNIYSKDDLKELLNCFLQLNSPYYHGVIVRAFTGSGTASSPSSLR